MISKPILKQSIKNNWKLWAIITTVASIILSGFIISYDAVEYAALAVAAEGTAFASLFSSATTLLGSLENFYKLIAVILGIVYTVFTANNLVVNEVDSGSMAYTLSTPITRSSVIFSKSLYLILSTTLMYFIISMVGLGVVQFQYNNVSGYPITDDIKVAAKSLNQKESYVSERLYLILNDTDALSEGALERDMDIEAYTLYLENKIVDRTFEENAIIITDERYDLYDDVLEDDEIEITYEALIKNPKMILDSQDALKHGAKTMGLSLNDYHHFVTTYIAHDDIESIDNDTTSMIFNKIIDVSAETLNLSHQQVKQNLSLLKTPEALDSSTKVSGLSRQQIIDMANKTMIEAAISVDNALDFDTEAYFYLSIGLALLILSLSSISFFASTLFNRTNFSLALGGGVPFAFFLITMVQQLMDSSDNLKYLNLTTLFNTEEILILGDFKYGLLALLLIATVLYTVSNFIFTKKDLPL